jgi:hypothetical protein
VNCVAEIEFDVFISESKNYKIIFGGGLKSFWACLASCRGAIKWRASETHEQLGGFL